MNPNKKNIRYINRVEASGKNNVTIEPRESDNLLIFINTWPLFAQSSMTDIA
ncbi:MAG: hypothetical protein ACI8WB_006228 [Phenylobacterium sp.]|jgi:hypothetical protein